MGFTGILALVYLALVILDIAAFVYGSRRKNLTGFIIITAVMVMGIIALGYLWITSPM